MPSIVRVGDMSDHGGVMVSASGGFTVDGIEGCVNGDLHQCPITGHGTTPVFSSSIDSANGKAIVRSGDVAGCGAVLIGTGSATAA